MGKNKQNNRKSGSNRFFRWIRSDLPDEQDKKPVLLLGVNKITDSPFARRRCSDGTHTTGSIRFFRPTKPKYTRGIQADERLEKIRQDLLTHQNGEVYIPNDRRESSHDTTRDDCKLNCAGIGNCVCKRTDSSNRGSFSFHRPDEPNDIEFKYTEHVPDVQPCTSKTSYNVTPKSTDRRSLLLSNLNERFRKTLSLDSRKVDTNLSLPQERPKSLVNTGNNIVQCDEDPFLKQDFSRATQPKKKRKSFFSLETFFDKKSDCSSIDDYVSSKYKRFELEDSPLLKRPDLLNLPVIIDSVRKQSDTKRQLEKLESHFYKNLNERIVDAVPKDATEGPSGHTNAFYLDDEVEYIEPIRSNFTSQSTLILEKNIPKTDTLSVDTDETDIKLPCSVSPRYDDDSIGRYEIEVKESDLLRSQNLTVKVMDKSIDSIGSCSLDVDASTDFSDTTSGSLNLLTPSSTASRARDFTTRLHERAHPPPAQVTTPQALPIHRNDNLLKPPPKVVVDSSSHRSRTKKREDYKKPSYLNLACSVNGYTNLTTYDSKLRQDINKSREASPIRPIIHQYKTETNSLLVPVPISANKLIVPTFPPHDSVNLTVKAPTKAHTDPYLATSPINVFMAEENKQLKKDFLASNMAATTRPYMSAESKNFAASMLQDEIDNAKEISFKSSYSETNFRKTANGSKVENRFSSESYTINSNGVSQRVEITKENGEILTSPMKSFIQQRVERLYGPGALAQGFFNQKRHKMKSQSDVDDIKVEHSNQNHSFNGSDRVNISSPNNGDPNVSLPVLRHLRPEFRAQLPILSPKKSPKSDIIPEKKNIPEKVVQNIDFQVASVSNGVSVIKLDDSVKVNGVGGVNGAGGVNGEAGQVVKDGHYFLKLEKVETERLLALSASAEKELESLQDKEDVSEEILGLLRSAAGKARLLATQKMQQFEGLCYNNINDPAGVPFPTTAGDLQGFWDMVCLQVDNVDALYRHIADLKANGWREISPPAKKTVATTSAPRATRTRTAAPAPINDKAKAAADRREAERRALMEHRRRVARERQLAARAGGSQDQQEMGIEGSQEVEIFVGKGAKPTKVAPKGDCRSAVDSEDSIIDDQS